MAVRVEVEPEIHREGDARWGDPALQALEDWLIDHGVPDVEAAALVEGVWVFYSYDLLPTGRRPLPMGIAGKAEGDRRQMHLFVTGAVSAGNGSGLVPETFLLDTFERTVGAALAPSTFATLRFVDDSGDALESWLRSYCEEQGLN